MTTSQNGWSASPTLKLRPLVVNGIAFAPGIRDDDDVEYVFRHFVTEYAARVEPLKDPGCWGFSFRADKNQASDLSNHASGTAIDLDAPEHPNGVPTSRTFTAKQIAAVHVILGECHGALRWGGDYTHTVDAMHVEVNVSPGRLKQIAAQMKAEAAKADKPQRPEPVKDALAEARQGKQKIQAALAKDPGPAQTQRLNAALVDQQRSIDHLKSVKKR